MSCLGQPNYLPKRVIATINAIPPLTQRVTIAAAAEYPDITDSDTRFVAINTINAFSDILIFVNS